MDLFLLVLGIVIIIGIKVKKMNLEEALDKKQTGCINGIFTLFIIASHFFLVVPEEVRYAIPYTRYYPEIRGWLGQLIVVPFLFYSGYGIAEQMKIRGEQYVDSIPGKRIFKVWIHYAMAVIAFLIMNVILQIKYKVSIIIACFFALESVGNSNWYIFAILMCYLMFYISYKCFRNKGKKNFILLLILTSLYILFMLKLKTSCWYNTILVFPLGVLVSGNKENIQAFFDRKKMNYYITFMFMLIITGFTWIYVIKKGDSNPIFMLLSIVFALDILLLNMRVRICNPILSFLGTYSFEIYILQRIPMTILQEKMQNKLVCFCFVILFTVLMALVFKKMEKIVDKKIVLPCAQRNKKQIAH